MELKYVTRTGKKLKVYKTKNGAYFIRRPNGKRYLNMKQIKASHKCLKKKVRPSHEEVTRNPRSRSAVMRVFKKL